MTAPERDPVAEAAEGVKPDYTRLGFRDLQRLAKARGLPGDGSTIDLVTKLRAFDVQHGREVDLALPDEDEVDLLADDDANLDAPPDKPSDSAPPPTPVTMPAPAADKPDMSSPVRTDTPAETPTGGGEAASAPPPAGPPPRDGLPAASDSRGRANLNAKSGPVGTGEGHGGATARAFRQEFPLGNYEITDDMHARFIADTHGYAQRAGFETKGGQTIGERVGFGADSDGHRTVIYQVPLRRTR